MSFNPETLKAIEDITARVTAAEVPVRLLKSHLRLTGDRRSLFRGDGDDFDGHDIYAPGDDPRYIDWNATAITGGQQVLIGLYKETTQLPGYVLTDVSPTMDFGTERVTKRYLAAELGACVVRSLGLTKDPVGLIVYSNGTVEHVVKPKPATAMRVPVIVHSLETEYTPATGTGGLAAALARLPKRPAMIFIMSDFMNMGPEDWEALELAGMRHAVFCFFLQDQRERELPVVPWPGCFYNLRDHTGANKWIWNSQKSRADYAANWRRHESSILAKIVDSRCHKLVVSTEEGEGATPSLLNYLATGH